jgi:enoyl-CoA hydratase/carnithine racemase
MRLGFQIVCAQRLATSKSVNYSIDENLKAAKITLTNPKKRNTLSLQTIQ